MLVTTGVIALSFIWQIYVTSHQTAAAAGVSFVASRGGNAVVNFVIGMAGALLLLRTNAKIQTNALLTIIICCFAIVSLDFAVFFHIVTGSRLLQIVAALIQAITGGALFLYLLSPSKQEPADNQGHSALS
jgi:NhaP-type Na+/H+ or K+/H+ antiporter